MQISRRRVLKGAAIASALGSVLDPAARARETPSFTLRVASYGGAFTLSQRRYVGDIFTQTTGIKVEYIDGSTSDQIAKLVAAGRREPPYDVIYMVRDERDSALGLNIFGKVDPKIVTNLQYLYDDAKSPDGYGPGIAFYSVGITYNTEKFQQAGIPAPTSWQDLWNPKLAGRVGIATPSLSYGREFIVAATRLQGGDESTPEKGIDYISQIKAYSYFAASAPLAAAFTAGDVWAAPWINAQSWRLIDMGVPLGYVIPSEGGIGGMDMIDMIVNTPHQQAAQLYINMALGPLAQLGNATDNPLGPSNTLLAPILKDYPQMSKRFPASPDDLKKLYLIDWLKFMPHRDQVIDDWNRKMAGK